MVQDADGGFGGAFFVGYHGGAGDADAVLCHTYTPSVIYEARINGVPCSEATINAGLLGYYGVPLLLVSGDRTTVEGVRAQMPWVHGVAVKDSIGNFAAASMLPSQAQEAIRDGAEAAITQRRRRKTLPLRSAGYARRSTRNRRAGPSRRDHSGIRTNRVAQRPVRSRFLSRRF